MSHVAVIAFLTAAAVSLFSFVSVAAWAHARRLEREAFYKSETMKKVAESPGGSSAAIELLREEERIRARRRRDGLRLGGLVNLAVGIGLWVFLLAMGSDRPLHMVGLIPMLVGVVLAVYSFLPGPKV